MVKDSISYSEGILAKYFTDDAWHLVQSFFSKLQKKMDIFEIPLKQRNSVLEGLIGDFLFHLAQPVNTSILMDGFAFPNEHNRDIPIRVRFQVLSISLIG